MYNKLFTRILDSSIWLESHPTRIVWITLLASMDEDGFCAFASAGNVARRAGVTIAEAEAAFACLESPDENSFDPDHNGRRVERVPGGWIVLNATKFRDIVSRKESQRINRERQKRYYDRHKQPNANLTKPNVRLTQPNAPNENPNANLTQSYTEAYIPPNPPEPNDDLTQPNAALDDARTNVSRAVRQELQLGGRELSDALWAVVSGELREPTEAACTELRDRLVSAWRSYLDAIPRLEYATRSASKFFGGGLWDKPQAWPWKQGNAPRKPGESALERLRRERAEV